MKNKLTIKVLTGRAVAVATAFFIGAAPITACAEGGETETRDEEKQEAEVVEESGALTPDGNLTLVDDYGDHESSGKQFITVVTKSGNYFYIIIDRDDNGNQTVHFLNMVDEADLLALMNDEEVKAYTEEQGTVKTAKEPDVSKVTEEPETSEKKTPEAKPETKNKKTNAGALAGVFGITLIGLGAYFYFTKMKGKSKKTDSYEDPDADYNEEESVPELTDEEKKILNEEEEN